MSPSTITVTRRADFCAAHRLPDHPGKCKNLHGHNFNVEITVTGGVNPMTGMIVDFADLKDIIEEEVVRRLDHALIVHETDVELIRMATDEAWKLVVMQGFPTVENLCTFIAKAVSSRVALVSQAKGNYFHLTRVLLTENEKSFAVWERS